VHIKSLSFKPAGCTPAWFANLTLVGGIVTVTNEVIGIVERADDRMASNVPVRIILRS
jgi:hypothetical protein